MKLLKIEKIGGRGYVKKITGFDHKTRLLIYEKINGNRDCSKANSKGSRGIYEFFILEDGIYEIENPLSWGKNDFYYLKIIDGKATRKKSGGIFRIFANEKIY
jgi:hypothetical protein